MKTKVYERAKSILRRSLPSKEYDHFKKLARNLGYIFYIGSNCNCPICETSLRSFISAANGDDVCPRCGSIARTRSIWKYLFTNGYQDVENLLHFSPNTALKERLSRSEITNYITSDYCDEFVADMKLDIQNIDLPDSSIDTVICFHVLEHIEQDELAMKELYRVLRRNGVCLIQTPYKDGDIYEDPSIIDEVERLKHFGQKDHVRIYSVEGLTKRLESTGFIVSQYIAPKEDIDFYGLTSSPILVARKM